MEASRRGDEGSPRKKSRSSSSTSGGGRWWWRWMNAARYVVGLALTAVIMVVIVYAFKVELREKQLVVTVRNGLVAVQKPAKSRDPLTFVLTVKAFNPSGHGQVFFTDVIGYLAANNGSGIPWIFSSFNLTATMRVLPQSYCVEDSRLDYAQDGNETPYHRYFYDKFNSGANVTNATLRLEGTLRNEAYLGYQNDGRPVVYCCSITIGYHNTTATDAADSTCMRQKASMAQQSDSTLLTCEAET